GQYITHVESGALRAIASASPKRLGGAIASTPTWAELGHPAGTYETWRALIAPKGVTPEQVAYWEEVMRKVAESESFQASARRNQSEPVFIGAAETRSRMETQYEQAKKIMTYLGLVK
ncbi:MAG TPA: tripartite tricarboxylate transporter substrate-binding protein, partial [Burkholderiales bacterium]|nr:tripartite tricarboxylate transporter substrate-binding protein [Burkholderiales bacterium]